MGTWELIFIILIMLTTIYWLGVLILASLDGELDTTNRSVWLIGIALTHFVGATLYLLARLVRKVNRAGEPQEEKR